MVGQIDYLLRGGVLSFGSLFDAGSYGGYWSSTPDGYSGAYSLDFSSDYVRIAIAYVRYYGFSVRCVAAG